MPTDGVDLVADSANERKRRGDNRSHRQDDLDITGRERRSIAITMQPEQSPGGTTDPTGGAQFVADSLRLQKLPIPGAARRVPVRCCEQRARAAAREPGRGTTAHPQRATHGATAKR